MPHPGFFSGFLLLLQAFLGSWVLLLLYSVLPLILFPSVPISSFLCFRCPPCFFLFKYSPYPFYLLFLFFYFPFPPAFSCFCFTLFLLSVAPCTDNTWWDKKLAYSLLDQAEGQLTFSSWKVWLPCTVRKVLAAFAVCDV